MLNEHVIIKIYWSIGEVSEQLQIAPSKIRFYEKAFGFTYKRNKHKDRRYTASEIDRLRYIANLAKHWKISAIKTLHERGNLYTALIETQHLLGI